MEERRENQLMSDCQVNAQTKGSLLQHLEEHGIMSLLTSQKFAPYFGCLIKEIGEGIIAADAPSTTMLDATGGDSAVESGKLM